MSAVTAESGAIERAPARTVGYAWYVAALLSLAQIVSVMDRYVLSVVLENVKRDLALTDTQLGVLQGPGFVFLFTLASLPFGRLADVRNRRLMIASSLLFWSAATIACGFAQTFDQLMCARLAVGLGEAALLPAAMSLIVAYFSKDKLNRGMAIYSMGSSLGRAAGFAGGGAVFGYLSLRDGIGLPLLGRVSAWHGVFLFAGCVGVFAALLFFCTVREPARRADPGSRCDVRAGFAYFWRRRWAYLAVFVPFGMINAVVQQLAAWSVSFYQRQHGLTAAAAGTLIGTTGLLFGPIGHLSGGWLSDRLTARGVRAAQPLMLGVILLASPVFVVAFARAPTVPLAAASFAAAYFLMSAAGPNGYGGAQVPTADAHRGVISSIFLIFFTVLGAGIGPWAAGFVGDRLFHGAGKLGSAMVATTILFALAGLPFAIAGRRAFDRAVVAAER